MGDPMKLLTLLLCIHLAQSYDPLSTYNLVYGWKQIDYKFPSEQTRNRLLSSGEYIPENNVITGIKVWGSRIFLTVPRWRRGIPASLAYIDFDSKKAVGTTSGDAKGPLFNPYPSWEMNQLGNCNAFQYVQSMEIDQFGRMWVVDIGRVNIFGPNRTTSEEDKCPPKLVLLDINTGEMLRKYEFPKDVVSPTSNFLNDVAVACLSKDNCYAYISDALDSKIVVYNYLENRSWFVHHASMIASNEASNITILGNDYKFAVNVDGITLSPIDSKFDRLYYCPLSSFNIFSVPTSILRTAVNGDNLPDSTVKNEGLKSSQSDGLAMDATGLLFFGLLGSNGVSYYNTSSHSSLTGQEVLLVQNDVDLQWPDTFGFDDAGYLYVVTNRLQRFRGNFYDFSETNFRVVRIYVGSQSYMYADRSKQKDSSETIPPSLYDATPRTNQDDLMDDKNKYSHDTGDNNGQRGRNGKSKESDKTITTNSSIALDSYTKGVLIFVLVAFAFQQFNF